MKNIIIYVLCYDDKSEQQAIDEFSSYEWARIYRIKDQCALQEGVMYRNELMDLYDEWKDKDYVGTVAYCMFSKLQHQCNFWPAIETADPKYHDVVYFTQIEYDTGRFGFHTPSTKRVFYDSFCKAFNYPNPINYKVSFLNRSKQTFNAYVNFPNRFVYYNYFMATPEYMIKYIEFFSKTWLPLVESHPNVWEDSNYTYGKLTGDQLIKLNGRYPYYTNHTFVNERILCPFFDKLGARTLDFPRCKTPPLI